MPQRYVLGQSLVNQKWTALNLSLPKIFKNDLDIFQLHILKTMKPFIQNFPDEYQE